MSRSTASATLTSKTWKGVAAGVAAVAILAGGGASFAEWRASAAADNAATITSGVLDISSNNNGTWTNRAGVEINPAEYVIVPGEELTYTESMTIDAEGDGLEATVSTNIPSHTGGPELVAALRDAASLSVTLDGETYAPMSETEGPSAIVPTNDGEQTVGIEITIPFDAVEQVAQGQHVNIGALEVTVAQTPMAG
ncbi:alternate-type signal peptide domain-containing protein [Georgenia sp. Z1344]|uniref:alternate-type signal peptide domain-containing protein n=1 Tax=Georgenia sp. Z1344 TaxID=3416706 RepID=UPI003CEFD6D2